MLDGLKGSYPATTHTAATVPAIYAHRGSSIMAPENTLPAYQWSLDQGCDVLETDIRISRDGCLFMFHDATLERTTNGFGAVADTSSADLKQLDAAYRFYAPGEQLTRDWQVSLLTLEELFASYPTTRINIDVKDNLITAADEVIRLIDRFDRQAITTVGSFHTDVIIHLRQQAPYIRTAALQQEVAQLYFGRFLGSFGPYATKRLQQDTQAAKPRAAFQALQIPLTWRGLRLATPAFVRFGQRLGYDMVYWTVNDVATLQRLKKLGVDGVVTDRTDIARKVFAGG